MRQTPPKLRGPLGVLILFLTLGLGGGLVACAKGQMDQGAPVDTAERRYVGKSVTECSTIRFVCQPGERYFADDRGCGCEVGKDPGGVPAQEPKADVTPADDKSSAQAAPALEAEAAAGDPIRCTSESRKAEICTMDYSPVCGLFDPKQVQCIMAPCGATFSNACTACIDKTVISYTQGECKVGP